MAFDPCRAERDRGDVCRNPEVVPRESDSLDTIAEAFLETRDLEQADIVELDRVAGSAGVEQQILRALLLFEEADDLFLFILRGHTQRQLDLAAEFLTQDGKHVPVEVGRRRDLEEFGVERSHLASRGDIPDRCGISNPHAITVIHQLFMLVYREF